MKISQSGCRSGQHHHPGLPNLIAFLPVYNLFADNSIFPVPFQPYTHRVPAVPPLSTSLFVLGIDKSIDLWQENPDLFEFIFYDEDGNKQVLRLREELAIVFQHEIDHLNGILFYDRIDKNNPYKDANKYRAI